MSASPGAPASAAPAAASASPAVGERNAAVVDRIKQMSAYLRTLKSFSLLAYTSIDEVLESGQKVQFGGLTEYRYVAPDKLRAALRSDRMWRDFYYDGKALTQVAPRAQYYASVPVTGSVGAVVGKLASDYDIEFPLADLFVWGNEDSTRDLRSAVLVGPARIGNVDTDHFAMRQAGVDWQVWVQKGAQPLPRKIVITTTDEPEQPQYTAVLNWNLNFRSAASEFTYTPPKGAVRITQVKAGAAAAAAAK